MTTTAASKSEFPTIAIKRCADYKNPKLGRTVEELFSLLGGVDKFISKSDNVLIKPNFIVPKPPAYAVQTDPALILAVAQIVKEAGGKVIIGDSPAWNDVYASIRALELEEPLKKLGAVVRQLNKPKRYKIAKQWLQKEE